MKKTFIIITAMVLCSITAYSQENAFTLSGGYAFANVEDVDESATGYRINGLYEFIPMAGNVAHGLSIGYIGTKASYTQNILGTDQSVELKLNSWPIYYAPKFMFGSDKFKGFVKGALGMHFSKYKATGDLADGEPSTNDAGFYGGAALGGMLFLSESMFLNLEYEWAYLSNAYYKDGFMNTASLGIGMKF